MAASTELLAIGKQCFYSQCHLVDFLPFTCQHCKAAFCQEHFMVNAHQCPDYDASKHDRIAPDCPFCNIPVAVKPGQDPNVRLEEHFDKECAVLGKQAKKSPVCSNKQCQKVLFAPIACQTCKQQFCPTHRFPDKHSCKQTSVTVSSKPQSSLPQGVSRALTAKSRLLELGNKTSAAMDTMKKAASSTSAGTASSNKTTPASSSSNNPFSKTDSVSRLTLSPPHDNTNVKPTNETNHNANTDTLPNQLFMKPFVPRPIFTLA